VDTNGYYALLFPVWVCLLGAEALVAWRQGRRVFTLPDTLSNLACGLGQVLLGLFTAGFILASYEGFRRTFALVRWPSGSWVPWALAFLLVDLCYYVWHRSSHAVALLWAVHLPHHQSERMNTSVALRQPWLSDGTALLFFWPAPLLGVPAPCFFFAVGCLSIYEALCHSQVLDRTGAWGKVFNTPAWHRLHHAHNGPYLDRNFGSTLIVWDRLFGTFVQETVPPRYGTATPLASWNPVWAQLQPFLALLRRARQARSLGVLFGPPASGPQEACGPLPTLPAVPPAVGRYALVQFLAVGAGSVLLLRQAQGLSLAVTAAGVALVTAAMSTLGGLLDGRPWAPRAEVARLLALVPLAFLQGPLGGMGVAVFALGSVGQLYVTLRSRREAELAAQLPVSADAPQPRVEHVVL
jgi:sterol desaturase/sphingolipid hydroxylase (fatty acid hydroxylase superfamily)